MKTFRQFIAEKKFSDLGSYKKDKWLSIPIDAFEPGSDLNKELYDLIDRSYAYVGGHLNYKSPDDLPLGKDPDDPKVIVWQGIDFDSDPEPDVIKTYKKTPFGKKSVLGATDGSVDSKVKYVSKMIDDLSSPGNYVEVSDAIMHILIRNKIPAVQNQKDVEQILNKKVTWIGPHPEGKYPGYEGFYKRKIGGEEHMKILLGNPNL